VKIAIYTVIIGNYDIIFPITPFDSDIDYFILSDIENLNIPGWKSIKIDNYQNLSPQKLNRFYKFFPNYIFKEYVFKFCESKALIGLLKHPDRKTVKEEIEFCKLLNKGKNPVEFDLEYKKYLNLNFCDDIGLTENSVIIRKHNDNKVINAMILWWDLYLNGSGRDQISLPFVRKITYMPTYLVDIELRKKNRYFRVYEHNSENTLFNLFIKFKVYSFHNPIFIFPKFILKVIITLKNFLL
jgi:hypothetical protein